MARFRDEIGSGKNEQKLLVETVMQLYPIYLELIQLAQYNDIDCKNQSSIVILQAIIGNVGWYAWKSKMEGTSSIDRDGFDTDHCVLRKDCEEFVQNTNFHWVPSVFLFSFFLEGVLTGKIDTDKFPHFPKYVFQRLPSNDRKKVSRKVLKKLGYEYIEAFLGQNEEAIVDLEEDDDDIKTRHSTTPTSSTKMYTKTLRSADKNNKMDPDDDKKPAFKPAKKQRTEAEEKKSDDSISKSDDSILSQDNISPQEPQEPRRSSRGVSTATINSPSSSTAPNGVNVSTPKTSNSTPKKNSKATTSNLKAQNQHKKIHKKINILIK